MVRSFNIGDICANSWKRVKDQIWILAGLLIAFTILSFLIGILSMSQTGNFWGQWTMTLLTTIIGLLFDLGYMRNIFQTLDGYEPQFSAYGHEARKILTFFLSTLLVTFICSIGLVFFVLPGFYLFFRLQFFVAFIIEEDSGIIASLQKSWAITRGNVLDLFLIFLIQLLIFVVGMLLLGIGLFVAIPYINMIYCDTFRRLNVPVTIAESEYA